MSLDDSIQEAAKLIKDSQYPVVLTGAGVSKESGVPTFRDALEGLWAKFDPMNLATVQAFKDDPKTVWDWYAYRREMVAQAKPNPGHLALAKLEKRYPTMEIITQNVDDLHEQAGSQHVIHLHGNITQCKCFYDCQGSPTLVDIAELEAKSPPDCPYCGRWVRPNVVWFGEMLPMDMLEAAQLASSNCDVMIVIGTSGLVTPAAGLPGRAQIEGAKIIEVNPDYSMITRLADIKLEGPSGEIMPRLLETLDNV